MANTRYTIIKPSVSNALIDNLTKNVRDIRVEEDGIRAFSRGFYMEDLLEWLSLEHSEVIIAEHLSSLDRYSSRTVIKYENGKSVIINDIENYIIYYYKKDKHFITQEVIDKIHKLVKQYAKNQNFYDTFNLNDYKFIIAKKRYIIEVSVIEKSGSNRNDYNGNTNPRKIEKFLIPQLIAEAEGQAEQFHKLRWWQ